MEHTITGGVHRLWINGEEAGEMSLSAGVAGAYGVPIVAVTSDRAGIEEAERLFPWAGTACVKTGVGRYMAQLLEPEVTGPMIEAAVQKGIGTARHSTWKPEEPTVIRIEFNRAEEADYCMRGVEVERIDAYTVEVRGDTYLEAHRAAWMLFALSLGGRNTGD